MYTWGEGDALESHLINCLESAKDKLGKDFPAWKVIFCPLIASELSRVINFGNTSAKGF